MPLPWSGCCERWDRDWRRWASVRSFALEYWLRANSKAGFVLAWVQRLHSDARSWKQIGGFASIVNHLADDYELGKRIADLGLL